MQINSAVASIEADIAKVDGRIQSATSRKDYTLADQYREVRAYLSQALLNARKVESNV